MDVDTDNLANTKDLSHFLCKGRPVPETTFWEGQFPGRRGEGGQVRTKFCDQGEKVTPTCLM